MEIGVHAQRGSRNTRPAKVGRVWARRAQGATAAVLTGGTLSLLGLSAAAGATTSSTTSSTTTTSTTTSTTVPSYGAQSPSYSSQSTTTTTSASASSSTSSQPTSSTTTSTSPGYTYTFGPGEQSPSSTPVTGNTSSTSPAPKSTGSASATTTAAAGGQAAPAAATAPPQQIAGSASPPAPGASVAGILQTVAGAAPLPGGPGNGAHSTVPVITGLQDIKATQTMIDSVLAPFPVAGPATYSDDFGEARGFPLPHIHQGVDIAAAQGTPLLACAPGVVTVTPDTSGLDPDGGNSLSIVALDGTRYYYAHLVAYAPGLASGQHVVPGQVIGGVGMTGDATGPHLHFEIHPGGGAAVDPTPFLDRWLSQALQTAQALGGGIPSTAMAAADISASPSGRTGPAAPAATGSGTEAATMTLRAVTPDRSALQTALASVNASQRRAPSPAASIPFLAAVGAVLFWLILRYRQRRLAGLGLAAARAGLPGPAPDPSDPLWSSDLRPLARAVPARRRNAPNRREAKAKDS